MMNLYISIIYFGLVVLLIVGVWRLRRRSATPGAAMFASMEKLYDDQRRAAVELIIEEKAAARDPEHKDGDLPQLENPRPLS